MASVPFDTGPVDRTWEPRTTSPVQIAVAGIGFFSQQVAIPAIEKASGVEVSVLITSDPESIEGSPLSDDRSVLTYEDYHDGVRVDAYDAVYVATPNKAHLPIIETAAQLGKDVISEKPLEGDSERSRSAITACDEAEVGLMVAYRMQFDPAVRKLRALIDDGVIGDLSIIEGSFTFPTLSMSGPDSWRLDRSLAGGGPLIDLGVYPINTSRYVLDQDPASVVALEGSPTDAFGGMSDPHGTGVEEHIGVVLDFDGAISTVSASFNGSKTSGIEFIGTEGRLELSTAFEVNQERSLTYESDGDSTTFTPESSNEIVEMFEYFGATVDSGDLELSHGRDGLRDIEIVEAGYESSRSGHRVQID